MCKAFVWIKNRKIVMIKGKYNKGEWVLCDECGHIKIAKKSKKLKGKPNASN